jgi:hypothetical protein
MATTAPPDENARRILRLFRDRQLRAGLSLHQRSLVAEFSPPSTWTADDLAEGLKFAVRIGWLAANSNNFYMLTSAGFGAVSAIACNFSDCRAVVPPRPHGDPPDRGL